MNRRFAGFLFVASAVILLCATGQAQPPQDSTIKVIGAESVRVQPTLLRLEVRLHARGETADKAVEQLNARRKSATAELKELKAEEASVHFTNTVLTPGLMPTYSAPVLTPFGPTPPSTTPTLTRPAPTSIPVPSAPYSPSPATAPTIPLPPAAPDGATIHFISVPDERTAPVPGSLPAVPPATAPATYTPPTLPPGWAAATPAPVPNGPAEFNAGVDASTILRAEWRLTTSDPDDIALAGESLRAKLAAAGMFAQSNPSYPMPARYGIQSYGRMTDAGFTLSFVACLSDAQRKAAMTAALAKARQRAAELAEVAGATRRGLFHLQPNFPRPASGSRLRCRRALLVFAPDRRFLGNCLAFARFAGTDRPDYS